MDTAERQRRLVLPDAGQQEMLQLARAVRDEIAETLIKDLRASFQKELQDLSQQQEARLAELRAFYSEQQALLKAVLEQGQRRSTVTKSIVYDQYNRPQQIIEQSQIEDQGHGSDGR